MGEQRIGIEGLSIDDCRRMLGEGRIAEGLKGLEALKSLHPESGALFNYLGVALHLSGRSREALPHFETANRLEPDQSSFYQNQAIALVAAGEADQAVTAAERAVALNPKSVGGHVNLVLALMRLGRLDDAWMAIGRALEVAPEHPGLLTQAAHIAVESRRWADAERLLAAAERVSPDNVDLRFTAAMFRQQQGRDEEALREFDRLLKLQPTHQPGFLNAGVSLRNLGRTDAALRHFSTGLEVWPDWKVLLYNIAITRLYSGAWQAGWPDYELRLEVANALAKAPKVTSPRWDGGDIAGKTLLVIHEQGFGDVFQFVRLLAFAAQKAGKMIFVCPRRLHAVLSRLEIVRSNGGILVADDQPLPDHDLHVPLMSLLKIADISPESVPLGVSRIEMEATRLDKWRKFGAGSAKSGKEWRVGLAWQGNPTAPVDRGRSIPLAAFAPLAAVAGKVQFVSLQRFIGVDQPVPEGLDLLVPGPDFDPGEDGFVDTAALMLSLDLIITSDTAVAHLAGVLGRPVWLFLKKVPDWRWGGEGHLTAWYPTMRLFRQRDAGDWSALFRMAAAEIDRMVLPSDPQAAKAAARIPEAIDLHAKGQLQQAMAIYEAALPARRNDAQLLNFYAMALLETGKRSRAAAAAGLVFAAQSTALKPGSGDYWSNYAVLLDCLGSRKDSIRALRFGLAVNPGHVASLIALAKKESAEGEPDKALRSLKEVLVRQPDSVQALSALSSVYLDKKQPKEAERALRRAIALAPTDPKLWVQLGANLSAAERHAEAADCWERALFHDVQNGDAWSNLGVHERNHGELGLSIYLQRRAVECDPRHAEGWNNLGIAELEGASDALAIAAFKQAITVRPGYADAHLALGMALLNGGDFDLGLKHYEHRLQSEKLGIAATKPNLPYWTGGDPTGLRVFLMAEQGFGDAFQFSRYAIWLKAHGAAKVYIGCRSVIGHLLATIPGVDGVYGDGDKLPKADVVAFMMSMPALTGLTADSIPAYESYMTADPLRVSKWAEWLARKPGFRVGVVWQGNPDPKVDKGRSYPLEALEPLAKLPGVRLIALQKGRGEEQLEALAGRFEVERPGEDFDTGKEAFADTAAMMMNLDLVVTSDTAVAHLAGALGRPCWVVLKAHPEWRWQRDRSDSPWYPNTRLFRRFDREAEDKPFSAVMARLTAALAQLVAGDLSQRYVSAPAVSGPILPFDPVATFNRSLELQRKGEHKTAESGFAEVLDYKALRGGALHMLGVIALHAERNHRAVMLFREAERAGLGTPEFLTNLSIGLRRTGNIEEALSYLRKALAQRPTAEAHLSLGNILRDECQWDESLANYEKALVLKPGMAKAHRGIGNLMRDIHRPEESLAAFERARALDSVDHDLILDHAHAKLFSGDFIGGFKDYEARWGSKEMKVRQFDMPRWDGSAQPGKTLLVHGEQGFGDNIQFVRFVEAAAERVGRLILEVRGPLLGLFNTLQTSVPIEIAEQGRTKSVADFEIPMLSLPMVFGTTVDSVPPPARFAIPQARVDAWKQRFPKEGFNVGMIWQGNPKARADQGRSPPLSALVPLLDIDGVNFVSLQKTDGLDQIASTAFAGKMIVPGPALGDFAETAAAILALDLVISSCTATLHLAATLGVPVFGMLKYHADWRWLNERTDSPWYPSLRLFQQAEVFDWQSVVAPLREALAEAAARK